jgi:hypothetical protein
MQSPSGYKKIISCIIVIASVSLIFLMTRPAEALRLKTDWAQRVDLSQEIVKGEVIDTKSYWNVERTLIFTDVTIRVDESLKGNRVTEMKITIPGGTVGGDTHWVSDTPQFSVGDYGVILLESSGHVTGGPDGIYFLQKPAAGENRLLSSEEDPFLSWVKGYVRGETRASFELSGTEPDTVRPLSIEVTAISGVSPSTTPAGTGTVLTVNGSGFGASRGSGSFPTIAFRYKDDDYMYNNSKIVSWSDSQIQVELFTGVVSSYDHSPGSWNNTVAFIDGTGNFGSSYPLTVTFGYGRAKWMSLPVSYYTNTAGGPDGSLSAIQAAASTWSGAGALFAFNFAGSTTRGWAQDGYNVISFANLGSDSIIAWAITYYSAGTVIESDIQFNTLFPFSTAPTPPINEMDLQTIAVHELGHWLRLLDLYGANDTTKVMYGFCSYGQKKRSLTSGDQSGVQWIYGGESISMPTAPSGSTIGMVGTSYTYSTGGAFSSAGDSIQYLFDWGDGTNSGWLPVGTTSVSHSWNAPGTYGVKSQARCATHTFVLSSWSSTLSVGMDSISIPTAPAGPGTGATLDTYTFSTGGATSGLGHSIQYLFNWGDGTDSGWLPVGTSSAKKAWVSPGAYQVTAQARCSSHSSVMSAVSSPLSINLVSAAIALQSPTDGDTFNSSTLINGYQPTFSWTPTGIYTGFKILFSTSPTDFTTTGIKVAAGSVRSTSNSWKPSSWNWKTIMKSSNNGGSIRPIYWKVVGTKADRTTVESAVRSLRIASPQAVTINAPLNGAILDPAILPTFDFDMNGNTKFTLQISSLGDFSVSTKVKAFNFTVSNPNLVLSLQKTLSSFQWNGVKTLIGTGTGYFRIKAWDGLSRPTISEVRTFSIQ